MKKKRTRRLGSLTAREKIAARFFLNLECTRRSVGDVSKQACLKGVDAVLRGVPTEVCSGIKKGLQRSFCLDGARIALRDLANRV